MRVAAFSFGCLWLAVTVAGIVFVGDGRWLLWWGSALIVVSLACTPFEVGRLVREHRERRDGAG